MFVKCLVLDLCNSIVHYSTNVIHNLCIKHDITYKFRNAITNLNMLKGRQRGLTWNFVYSSVVPLELLDVPCSRYWSLCEIFKVIGFCPCLETDAISSFLVGYKLNFFGVLLVLSEDNVAHLKFTFYHLFVVVIGYLLFDGRFLKATSLMNSSMNFSSSSYFHHLFGN